jgi:putative ABC transport system substrate-binding protein
MSDVKRRDFISLLGGAAAWPLVARAQQLAMPVIGFLDSGSPGDYPDRVAAFRQGLKEVAYVEGENIAIDFRWANGRYDQLPALAGELVRRQAAVIFAATVQSALSAKTATSTIPIVFAIGSDPVKYGLAASLNRPGGNATGASWLGGSILTGKRLELLHEATPGARAIGALDNPTNPTADDETREIREAARALGLEIHFVNASTAQEIDAAFATLIQQGVGAVLIGADNFFFARRDQLIVGSTSRIAGDRAMARIRCFRRPDELRNQVFGNISTGRHLRRPNSQGRKAGGPANPASRKS